MAGLGLVHLMWTSSLTLVGELPWVLPSFAASFAIAVIVFA
jgi:hypothetical protein